MKGKTGISPFTIVEFFTKEARNEFLDMIKKAMLICHGQITVGRAQIPKYQREADQPFRCAIAAFSQCGGTRARYKPMWELLFALWHSGEWVLIAEASPVDIIIIHVQPSTREAFVSKFQGQKGQTKQYRPHHTSLLDRGKGSGVRREIPATPDSWNQSVQPMETDAANATPQTVSQAKGAGRGTVRQLGQVDRHQHSIRLPHTLLTTISTGAHESRRRAGEPGRPRGSTQLLTISSTDHFSVQTDHSTASMCGNRAKRIGPTNGARGPTQPVSAD